MKCYVVRWRTLNDRRQYKSQLVTAKSKAQVKRLVLAMDKSASRIVVEGPVE